MDNRLCVAVAFLAFSASAKSANNTYITENVSDTSRVYDIDEVVVSSKSKDLQHLRSQALSSTSLSARSLSASSARDMRDVALLVPSFVMPYYGSRYTSSIYVRGIGSRINNPAISMYVDDIPVISKSAFNTHLYDISRIDMLMGPQGTLYGQNAEGGIVRIYTKSPIHYQGTDIKASVGNTFWRMAEISHYGKIGNAGFFSASAFYDGQNGFQHNRFTNQRADNANEAGMRLKFIRKESERLLISLTADYQWIKQNGFAYGEYNMSSGHANDPMTNLQNNYMRHTISIGMNVNYKGKNADINSTTSYQYLTDHMQMDQDYMPTDYLSLHQQQLLNAITEEIAVKSHDDNKWRRVTGAFFSYQWLKTNAPVGFGEGLTRPIGKTIETSIYNSVVKSMTEKGMPEIAARAIIEKAGGIHMDVDMYAPGNFRTPQINAAIYHESSLQLSQRAKATIGLRYDLSHTSITYDTYAKMVMSANIMGAKAENSLTSHITNNDNNTFNQLLPKVGLTYEIGRLSTSRNGKLGNVYITASKGYRAGGYNIQMFSDILQTELMANRSQAMRGSYDIPHTEEDYANVNKTIAYKPETSWNYEIGAHLNLFGTAINLDIATYLMQIRNQQLSVMAGKYGFGRMMVNAGRSRSFGGEMTLRGSSFNNALAWTVAYGYTNATFRSYTEEKDGKNVSYRGKHVPYVPIHTLSANAEYTILTKCRILKFTTIGTGVTAQGKTFWDEDNTYSQRLYALLNAHALFGFKKINVNVWAKNLTNTRYCTFAIDSSASGEKKRFGQKGRPITFGVDLSLNI